MPLPVKRYLALLVTYLKPQWGRTLLMGALLLVNVGLQLLGPQIVRFFIDTVIARGPSTTLAMTVSMKKRTICGPSNCSPTLTSRNAPIKSVLPHCGLR